ncbi:NACHT domain-containing protein [Pseudonocardia acaciae]|uniref:NACHT domain-containing protein n=1 Tax=Pseudonocardia acaciae TaxID=551276 RepID=UPI00146FDC11|nr:NACHT domain-containing protein [Pseudonocardia acaciae]
MSRTTVASLAVLVGSLAFVVIVRVGQGSSAADETASMLAYLLAGAGVIVTLVSGEVERRRAAGLPATAEQVDQAAATLAGRVREWWSDEAQLRNLEEPMPVRWRLSGNGPMDQPDAITRGEPLTFAHSSAAIGLLAEQFRALRRGRLVITGGPGTGKTTLAVQLLRELLVELEPGEPVPVLLPLSGWDPDTEPRLQDWLATELDQSYPHLRAISHRAAEALAAQGRVLPILDGLDEVDPGRRAAIITALNRTWPGKYVLASRRPEFRDAITEAGNVLTGALVIAPDYLTPKDAAGYLRKHVAPQLRPEWRNILRDLAGGDAPRLAAVTETPLGLWLLRAVYADSPRVPSALTDGTFTTVADLRAHLLEELIPAVIAARPRRSTHMHNGCDLHRWLTTLAEQMRARGTRDWYWWQLPAYALPTRPRAVAVTVRLVVALTLGLVAAWAFGVASALTVPLLVGLPLGLAAWLALRTLGRRLKAATEVAAVIVFAIASGMLVLDQVGLMRVPRLMAGLLVMGLATGMAVGYLVEMLVKLDTPPMHPNTRVAGRGRKLAEVAAFGLFAWLGSGLVLGVLGGPWTGLLVGLAVGLVLCPAVRPGYGLGRLHDRGVAGDAAPAPSAAGPLAGHADVAGLPPARLGASGRYGLPVPARSASGLPGPAGTSVSGVGRSGGSRRCPRRAGRWRLAA